MAIAIDGAAYLIEGTEKVKLLFETKDRREIKYFM